MSRVSLLLSACMAAVSATVWFVISTATMDRLPDAWLVTGALVIAFASSLAFAGLPSRAALADVRETLAVAAGGALAFFVAPLLVLMNRATDAPSGSESLFFTTSAWAIACLVVGWFSRTRRTAPTQAAGGVLALVGAAALLANWERPSSFSPFIKFPLAETIMIVAGLLFAVGLAILSSREGRIELRHRAPIALAGAFVSGLVTAIVSGGGLPPMLWVVWPSVVLLGAAALGGALAWPRLAATRGLGSAGSTLLWPPVLTTALAVVERTTGPYGPNPVLWGGALTGLSLAVVGASLAWARPLQATDSATTTGFVHARQHPLASAGRLRVVALVAVTIAGGLAFWSLFTSALDASAIGVFADGRNYETAWTMVGAESAAGWLPVAAVALLAAALLQVGRSWRLGVVSAIAAGGALAAYPMLASVPLHTWTKWIPADIQQSYGTEYARFAVSPLGDPVRLVALVVCAVACVAVLVYAVRMADAVVPSERHDEECS